MLAGLDLSLSVREFKDIIKEMQNGVYGEDYRAVPGSTNMTYIMISQNRRENLKEGYRQLTGGISGNVSGRAPETAPECGLCRTLLMKEKKYSRRE